MNYKKRLTAIDLFSGSGGLTCGLKKSGFEVIGAVEKCGLASETYRSNHKSTELWNTDIQSVDLSVLKRKLGLKKKTLDLLAGCPPCQGFSTLKTLNGKQSSEDPQNDLIFEFQRFVCELLPKTVMLENVPALAQDYRMTQFCDALKGLGYSVEFKVLDVSKFGVPQRRRRTILLASLYGAIDWASESKKVKTVADAIKFLPKVGESGDPLHDLPEKRSAKVQKLISMIPKDGGSRTDLDESLQLDCHKRCDGFKDVYGRMAWDRVSPTITSGCTNPSKGRFIHPEEDRAITLREAALLQTFPKKYKFSLAGGKGGAALMIGNALPPQFVYLHANKVYEHLISLS